MKFIHISLVFIGFLLISSFSKAQTGFSPQEYYQFLEANQNLSPQELIGRFGPKTTYYSQIANPLTFDQYTYLDSVQWYYELTPEEWDLLEKHQFVVTERLSFESFGEAFHDVYKNDLPVFITTDAILQALHRSYDQILMDLEIAILEPKLGQLLDQLSADYPQLLAKYGDNSQMQAALGDVDLYITMAKSLIQGKALIPQFISTEFLSTYWNAVQEEGVITMPLFTENGRILDFSQFTVRGHYTRTYWTEDGYKTLGDYFKSMMWLGRMDFLLTPPPGAGNSVLSNTDIQRMNLGTVLLNELIDLSDVRTTLVEIDELITFMVGQSDNLTPAELASIIAAENLTQADELLDESKYTAFQDALKTSLGSAQLILSSIFIMDPFSTEPDPLPISFRLLGQRFIIDSYVFSNVVYDRIIYNDKKIWRPLPDPLDAMFVLGNDDALPLLNEDLDKYHYSSSLAGLRYLVDAYDDDFWDQSLYNVWLQGIRYLNPPADDSKLPFFTKTTAWHQQKLNTQLASWAQLRHDNLLYAKQSYTGGLGCSFPHSYIEPYPAFYNQIGRFASKAKAYFADTNVGESYRLRSLDYYFTGLEAVMDTLETLAEKELQNEPFSEEEKNFLQKMLFIDGMSGAPPYSGWYANLFYTIKDAALKDYVIADVHTQPTDEAGNMVGNVLHVGVGKVNLGVFLAYAPCLDSDPMAFVGPVMSYYEKVNSNFDRFTDERWAELVEAGTLPPRPDWTNIYLADSTGSKFAKGRELEGEVYAGLSEPDLIVPHSFALHQNYPNPFNPITTIRYELPRSSHVRLSIYDILGREVAVLGDREEGPGVKQVQWNASSVHSGIYFIQMQAGDYRKVRKMMVLK